MTAKKVAGSITHLCDVGSIHKNITLDSNVCRRLSGGGWEKDIFVTQITLGYYLTVHPRDNI